MIRRFLRSSIGSLRDWRNNDRAKMDPASFERRLGESSIATAGANEHGLSSSPPYRSPENQRHVAPALPARSPEHRNISSARRWIRRCRHVDGENSRKLACACKEARRLFTARRILFISDVGQRKVLAAQ